MKVLVIGGTGAMGTPLVKLLSEKGHKVYVTTRQNKQSFDNVIYLCGDAKNNDFFMELMKEKYDAIVDFMVYKTAEFENRIEKLLEVTDQYVFFSSARCYKESEQPLTEGAKRFVDGCTDEEYMGTDEYALAKGREENVLFESGRKNWTIIRPYITYNSYRMQLGVFEKEHWLKRVLEGKTIVFPKDIAEKKTSLTYGPDVAKAIVKLIGNKAAYGEAFHVTTSECHTWKEILSFYSTTIEELTGIKIKVKFEENSDLLQKIWNPWQIRYDRLYDRCFDDTKLRSVIGTVDYMGTYDGLKLCITKFLESPKWLDSDVRYDAWVDRQTNEIESIIKINGLKNKLRYLKWRFFCNCD